MNNVIAHDLQNSRLSSVLFLIYFLLKPFYVFGSGSVQPGDCVLLAAFFFVLFEERNFRIHEKDKGIALFVLCVAAINTTYFLIYQASDFMKSILYYVFNLIAILCFRTMMYDRAWIKKLLGVGKLNLLIQVLCFFAHIGKYWQGTYRYMGTYTDPNQLGFAVISTLAIIFLMDDKGKYLYLAVSAFLIFQTASSGMLLALVLLSAFDFANSCRSIFTADFSYGKAILAVCAMLALIVLMVNNPIQIDLGGFRIESKLNRGDSVLQTFIADRKLNVAVEHPAYFLFGYGEGFKFERYGHRGEMHSTWISLFFYYGIVPFIVLLRWIFGNIRGISRKYVPVYIAIFLEAFTLINHRQPSFWMIIMMGSLLRKEETHGNSLPAAQHCRSCISG